METMQMVKVEKLVPELRFKGFEGEFEYKKLGDVSNVIMGQSPDSKSYNENGEGYYLIQGNADIKNRISGVFETIDKDGSMKIKLASGEKYTMSTGEIFFG